MTPDEEARELRRLMLESIAEADNGLQLAERWIRGGKYPDALVTIANVRRVVELQDQIVQRFLRAHS